MNAAQLLDKVFEVYRRTFWKQLAFAAIVGVVSAIGLGVLVLLLAIVLAIGLGDYAVTAMAGSAWVSAVIAALVLGAAVLIWQSASATGAILLSREAFMGRFIKMPMQELWRAVGRAFTAMLAQLIVAVPYVILAGVFIFSFVRFAPYADLFAWGRSFYVVLIILLAAAALGLFLFLHLFSLAIAVAVNERALFFRTLGRSMALMRGHFWRLFGIRALWLVIVFIIMGSAQGIIYILPVLAGTLGAGTVFFIPLMAIVGTIVNIGGFIITFALGPLDGILIAVLYFNQKTKKEGFDMEIAIEDLYRAV